MSERFEVPRWSYEDIRRSADGFLAHYHATRSVPVPIEDILDKILQVNIVPIAGLLQGFDIDAFTSSDLCNVTVDEFIYLKRANRYRFSLAHEAGHIWMHRDLYTGKNFGSITEWGKFVDSIPEEDYSWLEWQANSFAGLVLVPAEHLRTLVKPQVDTIRASDISWEENEDFIWTRIAAVLAKEFEVSPAALKVRIEYEKIPEMYR